MLRSGLSVQALVMLALVVSGCGNHLPGYGAVDNLTTASIAPERQDDFSPNADLPGDGSLPPPPEAVSIGNDSGGVVAEYALQRARWEKAGTKVRFDGRCASACTMFLALPPENLCITRNAVFLFHTPTSPERSARVKARDYITSSYPDWVMAWIDDHGGLSRTMLRLDYRDASRHLPTCAEGGNAVSPT